MLAFVLPAYFHLKRPGRENEAEKERQASDKLDKRLIVFGILGGAVSFSVTLMEFVQTSAEVLEG